MEVSEIVRRLVLPAKNLATLMSNIGLGPGGDALSTLGLFQGSVWYVDSNVDSASGATSWATAVGTIAEAVALADSGDVILVAAGHNEGAGDAALFTMSDARVTIIGLGEGAARPILDYDHANTVITISANNCAIYNIRLRPSVTAVLIGIDIGSSVTGTVIDGVEAMNGEDGSGTDEFVKGIHLTSGNHDTVVRNTRLRCHASASHATHGVHVDAASDRCVFENVVIDGPWATAGILEDAASADTIARGCRIDVTGTNYGFVSTSTFAVFADNHGNADRLVNKLGQEWYPSLGWKVTKVEDVNAATSDDLFALTGKVNVRLWTFEVTNALAAGVSDYQITLTTLAGVVVAAGNLGSAIVGFMRTLNADSGDTALSTSSSAVSVAGVGDTQGKTGHLVLGKAGGSDVLKSVRTAGDASDAIRHDVFYEPLEAGASLVASA